MLSTGSVQIEVKFSRRDFSNSHESQLSVPKKQNAQFPHFLLDKLQIELEAFVQRDLPCRYIEMFFFSEEI